VLYVHFFLFLFEGLNFRHTLYPAYKSNRPPTPDTIVQGLQYLKASVKAMSVKVIEVIPFYRRFIWLLDPSQIWLMIMSLLKGRYQV
jgi:hypothetical protein